MFSLIMYVIYSDYIICIYWMCGYSAATVDGRHQCLRVHSLNAARDGELTLQIIRYIDICKDS